MPISCILLIDKPSGPTSHDIVARLRKTCGERRIGHTGTLDPRASGLLVLVLGHATRIATFLSGHDKTYEAIVELGSTTGTDDADGEVLTRWAGPLPDVTAIDTALAQFTGTFDQVPPQHSAKRVDGVKAYEMARRDQVVTLKPVSVTVRAIERTAFDGARLALRVTATSGFYVRSLARDLGERLGCGGHLAELRRTHVGPFDVADAIRVDEAERAGSGLTNRGIPAADALADWPVFQVNALGLTRAQHGNSLGPGHLSGDRNIPREQPDREAGAPPIRARILAPDGHLIAVAEARAGILHPVVVLG